MYTRTGLLLLLLATAVAVTLIFHTKPATDKRHSSQDCLATLQVFEEIYNHLNDPDWYGKLHVFNHLTGKVVEFRDLPVKQQKALMLQEMSQMTQTMTSVRLQWLVCLEGLKNPEAGIKGPPLFMNEGENCRLATTSEIEGCLAKLQLLRRKTAVKFEKTLVEFLDASKDEIPAAEREAFLQEIRKFHDREDLIDRTIP